MEFIKTCSQICIEADNNKDDLMCLNRLWNYVVNNKYHYPLVEIWFIREHIDGYVNHVETIFNK